MSTAQQQGPTLSVDGGGSLAPARITDADRAQRQAKADVVGRALSLVDTDAIALSAADWRLGSAVVRRVVERHGLPVVAANLVCDGARPYPPSRVVERGGRRLGVVGVTDGTVDGCRVEPAGPALQAAVDDLPPVDAVIALLPVPAARSEALVAEVPGLDFAVDIHPARRGPMPGQVGGTWMLGAGSRGKVLLSTTLRFGADPHTWTMDGYAATLDRELARLDRRIEALARRAEALAGPRGASTRRMLDEARAERAAVQARRDAAAAPPEGASRLEATWIPLETDLPEHGPTVQVLQTFLGQTQSDALAATSFQGEPVHRAPPGSPFLGAEGCRGCHPAITAQWAGTAHARAWQSLVDDQHAGDHACFACHSTGARTEGGPATPAEVGGLRDVQCEACHGPGRAHAAAPTEVHLVREPPLSTCTTCHDGEQDMGRFDPARYLPAVRHREERP